MKKNVYLIAVASILAIFGLVLNSRQQIVRTEIFVLETTDIIFGGHMYSYVDDSKNIFERLSVYRPDAFIYGGDSIWTTGSSYDEKLYKSIDMARRYGIDTLALPGNHDKKHPIFSKYSSVRSQVVGDIELVVVDTNVVHENGESCGLSNEQITSLKDVLLNQKSTSHRVLVSHHALWADKEFIADVRPNHETRCGAGFWASEIAPLIEGNVDMVVSGDGGLFESFQQAEKNGVRYVLSGMPIHQDVSGNANDTTSSQMTFLHIRSSGRGLEFGNISFQSELYNDPSYDVETTYRVNVDQAALEARYKASPLYTPGLDWTLLIEPEDVLASIKDPMSAEVAVDGGSKVDGTVNIRGNIGNHWQHYKKSWNIDLDDGSRQIKLVIPSDRLYSEQIIIQEISDALGSPTPKISLARLYINDIDFGTYLEFEDFDKAFLETRGFNSDAVPSKNIFRNHEGIHYVIEGPNTTTGDKQDKSYQQNLSREFFTEDNINTYFDAGYFARWVALKNITGDRHQNLSDNFRYFIDKATGRYVMVTWDATFNRIERNYPPDNFLADVFLQNVSNKQLVKGVLEEFVSEENGRDFEETVRRNRDAFAKDPAMNTETSNLDDIERRTLDYLANNVEYIKREWGIE